MAEIRTLNLKLLANISNFVKGMDQATKESQAFAKKVDRAGKAAGRAFVGIAGGAILAAKGLEEAEIASAKLNNVLTSNFVSPTILCQKLLKKKSTTPKKHTCVMK
jgi:hypothetical protein